MPGADDDPPTPAKPASTPSGWARIWREWSVRPEPGPLLRELLAADGFTTGFGTVDEGKWAAFVARRAADLGIVAGTSVFDVGCGAGAFLQPLHELGCTVSGVDLSPHLVEIARSVMPGRFAALDATALVFDDPVDVVVSCSMFQYLPSLGDAYEIIERMAAGARRAIALIDVPDQATEQAALAYRRATSGDDTYQQRYKGLEHLYFERDWVAEAFRRAGFPDVHVRDQDLEGYGMAPYRFNSWAFRDPAPAAPAPR